MPICGVADGLYAAGDIARFPLYGDGPPIRVEHWRVAEQHGRIAALNMLGQPTRYDAVPVFWTIQYLKRLDYIGHADRLGRHRRARRPGASPSSSPTTSRMAMSWRLPGWTATRTPPR